MTQFWDTDEEEEIDDVLLSKKPNSTDFTTPQVVTICKKCMQPVELEMIPGTKRIETIKAEDDLDLTTTKILSVADYRRAELCFYHNKKARGELT